MRRPLILTLIFVAGALATYGYTHFTREPTAAVAPRKIAAAPAAAPRTAALQTSAAPANVTAQSVPPSETASSAASTPHTEANAPTEDRVGKWIAEANSDDPRARADAILALGDAPRERAIPALTEVVNAADSIDAPLAMGSLKKLAINQGDADEKIRSVVRKAIYHGTDDSLASVAQATLSDIEVDLTRADHGAPR